MEHIYVAGATAVNGRLRLMDKVGGELTHSKPLDRYATCYKDICQQYSLQRLRRQIYHGAKIMIDDAGLAAYASPRICTSLVL